MLPSPAEVEDGQSTGNECTGKGHGDCHAEIARLAYRIWEDESRPEGRALKHWLQAEALVAAEATRRAPQSLLMTAKRARVRQPKTLEARAR